MTEYNQNKLRRLDTSLLLIFLGLMKHRKAALVAADLGLTNSSISHALRRLREVFEDDLFIRRPHGLDPTAFAEAIEPDIRRSLDALQGAITGPDSFDPDTATGHVRLSARDHELVSFLPDAITRLARDAPGLTFSVSDLDRRETFAALDEGRIDFAVGFFRNVGRNYDQRAIRTERYLVVARRDHPILSDQPTPHSFAACEHILVSGDGSLRGIVDDTLEAMGLSRRVVLAVPSFLPALAMLARTDFVATLPATVVRQNAALFGLGYCDPPIDIRSFDVTLLRHIRNRRNAMLAWCETRICDAN